MASPGADDERPQVLRGARLAAVPGLVHGFTTRWGPADGGLETHPDLAGEPWRRLSVRQVHGAVTWQVGLAGAPLERPEADALATTRPGDLLVVHAADCLPVLMAGLRHGRPAAVAAAHAGWRGLLAGVLESALRELAACEPEDALATLGPCIGSCCFEVGPEVADRFSERFGAVAVSPGAGDRSHVDLQAAAGRVLEPLGVRVERVAACTRCRPDEFHSYRAAGPGAGRNSAFIGMRS